MLSTVGGDTKAIAICTQFFKAVINIKGNKPENFDFAFSNVNYKAART